MGEKTEKATPKKLRDAKRKGQVAKSQDFPAAFTFVVSMAGTLYLVNFLYQRLGSLLVDSFKLVPSENIDQVLGGLFYQSLYIIFVCSLPIMVAVSVAGVLVTFVTVGPVFATEVFKFDIKKFNPVENLKNKFKMKTVFELIKSLLKIFIAGALVYNIMYESFPVLVKTVSIPFLGAMQIFVYFLYKVILTVGLFFVTIAVLDLAYQKHTFSKEMMMEKFEVKQEYKDSEGDPQIKSKRKQIAHEIAYSEGPAAGTSLAKAVVTNPVNLAIALGFDRGVDSAPYVLAMGQGPVAYRIIKIAESCKIPIVRNIPLAHELFEEAKMYEYIPERTYEKVAALLTWLRELGEEGTLSGVHDYPDQS